MTRTTIVLDPSLKKRAIKRAQELQVSMAELIRISIDRFLKEPNSTVSNSDSFFADNVVFKDLGKDVPSDLSLNHDQYLYDE